MRLPLAVIRIAADHLAKANLDATVIPPNSGAHK